MQLRKNVILNTQICFVIICHIPIRCIHNKKLNQVKIMSHFRIFKPYKTEILLNVLVFEIFSHIMHPISKIDCIFAQKY